MDASDSASGTPGANAPRGLPVFGHVLQLLRKPLALMKSLPAHGDVVDLRVGTATVTVVCDPELTRQVLLDDRTFDKGGFMYEWARRYLGGGLGTCPHSDHRRQRGLIRPAFVPGRRSGYVQMIVEHARAAVSSWRHGDSVDVTSYAERLSSQVALATLFPTTTSQRALEGMRRDITFIFGRAPRLALLPWTSRRRFARTVDRLHRSIVSIIAARRADGDGQDDLLSLLVAAAPRDEAGESDTEIVGQVTTFFVASYESTASTLAWAMHLLAQHPESQRRLQAELDAVLGGRAPTPEDVTALSFTANVVTETLRLFPPAWLATRVATATTQLGEQTIPKGRIVAYSPYLVHHRADLFTAPGRFDPDRWTELSAARAPFFAFGGGARKCIGAGFAVDALVVNLATVFTRWSLEPITDAQARPKVGILVRPDRLRLRVLSRTEKR
ncbi:cytochrome P450 [Allokutzneria multivorans]|uniref:Cytochrome P450 n=1 Tax=Allokutzneria multivorans TaxID=1142134 RepID=A0ABP7RUF3_9PSEU